MRKFDPNGTYTVVCRFCGKVHREKNFDNVFCHCGAKFCFITGEWLKGNAGCRICRG